MNLPLLYELQDLHKEMDVIIKKLRELQEGKDLRKLKDEYQRLKGEYFKKEDGLKKNAVRQESIGNEITNLNNNRKASESIKFSRETDTVKKLGNIERQLEKLEIRRQEAENDIIELINEADNINNELTEIKKKMAFIKKKYLSSKDEITKSIENLEAQKKELDPKIESLREKIDNESMEIYEKISKAHSDPVALVENRICSGCKMEVPAMDYDLIKNGSQELRCQSCGRLLYYRKP